MIKITKKDNPNAFKPYVLEIAVGTYEDQLMIKDIMLKYLDDDDHDQFANNLALAIIESIEES